LSLYAARSGFANRNGPFAETGEKNCAGMSFLSEANRLVQSDPVLAHLRMLSLPPRGNRKISQRSLASEALQELQATGDFSRSALRMFPVRREEKSANQGACGINRSFHNPSSRPILLSGSRLCLSAQ
jgi:hypothetical protein